MAVMSRWVDVFDPWPPVDTAGPEVLLPLSPPASKPEEKLMRVGVSRGPEDLAGVQKLRLALEASLVQILQRPGQAKTPTVGAP